MLPGFLLKGGAIVHTARFTGGSTRAILAAATLDSPALLLSNETVPFPSYLAADGYRRVLRIRIRWQC